MDRKTIIMFIGSALAGLFLLCGSCYCQEMEVVETGLVLDVFREIKSLLLWAIVVFVLLIGALAVGLAFLYAHRDTIRAVLSRVGLGGLIP